MFICFIAVIIGGLKNRSFLQVVMFRPKVHISLKLNGYTGWGRYLPFQFNACAKCFLHRNNFSSSENIWGMRGRQAPWLRRHSICITLMLYTVFMLYHLHFSAPNVVSLYYYYFFSSYFFVLLLVTFNTVTHKRPVH